MCEEGGIAVEKNSDYIISAIRVSWLLTQGEGDLKNLTFSNIPELLFDAL